METDRFATSARALAADGAVIVRGFVPAAAVSALAHEFPSGVAGERGAWDGSATEAMISPDGPLGGLAASLCGRLMRPVRVVRFDKTADANWMVPWHQDRTIAIAERRDAEGYGPWSTKAGVHHVEPPVALLERMLTLRLFVDACSDDQGPVEIALGSHRRGRVSAGEVAAAANEAPVLVATGGAADVLAMHPLALHRSARSRSTARRRVLHVDYAADALPEPLRWAMS